MKAPKITKSNIEQEIDLKEIFGVDFRNKRSLKEALAQAIIDKMVSRTESGKGISFGKDGRGRKVKLKSPYSKEYSKSDDFKAFGKSRSNVNLKLTGDMLGSIDVKSVSGNKVRVGITDEEEILKAFNHSTGDTVPKRPFFGVSKSELLQIKREFGSDIREIIKERERSGSRAFEAAVTNLLDRISDNGEG
jgi:hypothetical protein